MGTTVTLDVRDPEVSPPRLQSALATAIAVLHEADRVFSTYDLDSSISRLRRGTAVLGECPPDVANVLAVCDVAYAQTEGWFDAWAMPGGVDPTGLVKGWAAQRALRALTRHGIRHAVVNAAGDLAVTGNASGLDDGSGWRVGVLDPGDPGRVLDSVRVTGTGVATSASYERGPLAIDPDTQQPVQRLASATVIGPDLALADAYATAAVAHGPDALGWLEMLAEIRAILVTLDGKVLRSGRAARPPALRRGRAADEQRDDHVGSAEGGTGVTPASSG